MVNDNISHLMRVEFDVSVAQLQKRFYMWWKGIEVYKNVRFFYRRRLGGSSTVDLRVKTFRGFQCLGVRCLRLACLVLIKLEHKWNIVYTIKESYK